MEFRVFRGVSYRSAVFVVFRDSVRVRIREKEGVGACLLSSLSGRFWYDRSG